MGKSSLINTDTHKNNEVHPQIVVLSKTVHVFKTMDDRQLGDLAAIGKEYEQSQQLRARILGKLSENIQSSDKLEQKMSLTVNKSQIILTDTSI